MDQSASTTSVESHKFILPLSQRIAYSVGHVLNDLCASMWFTYLVMFQHTVLQFTNKMAGNLMLVGQVVDAICTPLVGYESDRPNDLWFCKYGRRKAWHLVGTLCVIGSFPFLFMQCIGCSETPEKYQFIYYASFIAIFQFGWAATQVAHLSLVPDLTPVPRERVALNAYRYAMTVLSTICAYSTLLVILGVSSGKENHIGPQDLSVFRTVALSLVGIGSFFSLIFHVFVKEKTQDEVSHEQSMHSQSNNLYDQPQLRWKDWFWQPQFYMVALLYMATRLYVNLSQVYIPLYIQDSLGLNKDKVAIIPLVIYTSGFISSFAVKSMNPILGNKLTYFIGIILGFGSCIWLYYGDGILYRKYEIYLVAVLIGVAGSTLLIISLSLTSELISNSTKSGAFVFGSMSFVDKLANGLALAIIQDFHPCIACCLDCKWYYQYVLVFACGGALILGSIALGLLLTQSVGVRKNEERLYRNSTPRINKRLHTNVKLDEEKPLLNAEDSDTIIT